MVFDISEWHAIIILSACCQVALKPVWEEMDNKASYGLLQAISVGIGDVISDLLQKTLDNVSRDKWSKNFDKRPHRLPFLMRTE